MMNLDRNYHAKYEWNSLMFELSGYWFLLDRINHLIEFHLNHRCYHWDMDQKLKHKTFFLQSINILYIIQSR
jgi:hypothetical protein